MIEVKSKFHVVRYLAKKLSWTDFFRVIRYDGYRGDIAKVPLCYRKKLGHSCCMDISVPLEVVLSAMKSNTRNEIRRAERVGCIAEKVMRLEDFIPFYNAFAEGKGLDDRVSMQRLEKYNNLLITKAVKAGKILAMHANVIGDDGDAMLLFSCSKRLDKGEDGKLIGWANRFLHFKDIEMLRQAGVKYYDWCGVCIDKNDSRYSIGQFKLSLGGVLIESWCIKSPLYAILELVRDTIRECMV